MLMNVGRSSKGSQIKIEEEMASEEMSIDGPCGYTTPGIVNYNLWRSRDLSGRKTNKIDRKANMRGGKTYLGDRMTSLSDKKHPCFDL
jgi:hypothetical protein